MEWVSQCHQYLPNAFYNPGASPSLAGAKAKLRLGSASNNKVDGDAPAVSDNGNYIVDLYFERPLKDVQAAALELDQTIGVVEHGFFVGMASVVIVAGKQGVFVEDKEKPKYACIKTKSWLKWSC